MTKKTVEFSAKTTNKQNVSSHLKSLFVSKCTICYKEPICNYIMLKCMWAFTTLPFDSIKILIKIKISLYVQIQVFAEFIEYLKLKISLVRQLKSEVWAYIKPVSCSNWLLKHLYWSSIHLSDMVTDAPIEEPPTFLMGLFAIT